MKPGKSYSVLFKAETGFGEQNIVFADFESDHILYTEYKKGEATDTLTVHKEMIISAKPIANRTDRIVSRVIGFGILGGLLITAVLFSLLIWGYG